MTMNPAEFEAKLVELRISFRARAANDADELEKLVQGVLGSGDRKRIQHLAHRLAGGAATFGLPDLTAPALLLEAEVIDGSPSVAQLTTTLILEIRRCVAQPNAMEAQSAS
jgi:HPt (histidine-containing phosphotransfer) domain-containing protein